MDTAPFLYLFLIYLTPLSDDWMIIDYAYSDEKLLFEI